MSTEPYERAPGLAAERTELAWGRSALALVACGAAVAKGVPRITGNSGHPAIGAAVLALGALVWFTGLPYARARPGPSGERPPARSRQLAFLAVGTATVGAAAFFIGAFSPG